MSGNIQNALVWLALHLVVGTYVLIVSRTRVVQVLLPVVLIKQVDGKGEAQGVVSALQAILEPLNCDFLRLHISDQNAGF